MRVKRPANACKEALVMKKETYTTSNAKKTYTTSNAKETYTTLAMLRGLLNAQRDLTCRRCRCGKG